MRLEALCTRAEHCTFELKTKLCNWGIMGTDADDVIESLIKNRFVDDLRFAQSFVRDRYRFSGYGRRKIAMALVAKRIPRDIIAEALNEIDDEIYYSNLLHITARKATSLNLEIFEERNKLYRYLISRGYESSLVARAIKEHIATQDN